MSTLALAIELAAKTYGDTLGKDGVPAIFHPLRVMMAEYEVEGDDHRIVGVLHDLLEDWPGWTLEGLRGRGFAPHILDALTAITRRKGEEYMAYIVRCARNEIARDVKLADLADNMQRCDMSPSPHNRSLHRRYAAARDYIESVIAAEMRTCGGGSAGWKGEGEMSNRLSPKQVEATIGYAPDNKTAADLAYEAAMALIVRPFLAFDARPVKPDGMHETETMSQVRREKSRHESR